MKSIEAQLSGPECMIHSNQHHHEYHDRRARSPGYPVLVSSTANVSSPYRADHHPIKPTGWVLGEEWEAGARGFNGYGGGRPGIVVVQVCAGGPRWLDIMDGRCSSWKQLTSGIKPRKRVTIETW